MGGQKLQCPEYWKMKMFKTILALEEGNIIFDLTPPPTSLKYTDTILTCKLMSPCGVLLFQRD